MAPMISINTLCLEPAPLARQVELIAQLGATAISPGREEIEQLGAAQAATLFRQSGLSVAVLTHRAFGFATPAEATAQRDRLMQSIEIAHIIGAGSVCMTTGGRQGLTWKEAAQRFALEIRPCVDRAHSLGVSLGLEPTSHLYADASIVHRLSDVVAVARAASLRVGIDLFACWADSDIEEAIAMAGPMTAFVQVSDYVLGDRGLPCRAVPGDGGASIDRLLRLILSTGYAGPFDLEIIGPRLVAEGREVGLRRAMARLQHVLQAR